MIDCHSREPLCWYTSRLGKVTTAAGALEHAVINRFGTLRKVRATIPCEGAKWPGLHKLEIHRADPQLRLETGVNHAEVPAPKRYRRTCGPDAQ